MLCCAGSDAKTQFDAAVQGNQSGIVPVAAADDRQFLAGRISSTAGSMAHTRFLRIVEVALEQIGERIEAVKSRYGPERIGVCVGSCDNGSELSLPAHKAFFTGGSFPADYELRYQSAAFPAAFIAKTLGIQGPAMTIATACASSAGAIAKGADLISSGVCDAVIAGGADIASATVLSGFDSLGVLSDSICNPFSKNRKGITLGDGAAFFVLSKEEDEVALLGYGESADAFHITAPRQDAAGAIRAMKQALAYARLTPEAVDYINLHGTGTQLNDQMEATAVAAVFQNHAPWVSSTKPITGHTLGAAGALELAMCWMALHTGTLPRHCWDAVPDINMPAMRFVGTGCLPEKLDVCMSNSFAFGGCNVSLIIGHQNLG